LVLENEASIVHRKTVRHYHEAGHLHELTFSCYQRIPLLTNDVWLEKLATRLDEAGDEWAMDLIGFVFMPDHVHLLVHPKEAQPALSHYLARIKQPFSKQVKSLLVENDSRLLQRLTVQERPGKMCFRFWQEGPGFDRNVFSSDAIESSLEYLHNNPVRRGLCRHAVDWKWSSARYYLHPPPRQYPRLPMVHGLPEGTLW